MRRLALGPVLPKTEGNMWDIMRGYVQSGHDTETALLVAMVDRPDDQWPPKVVEGDSLQKVGSERWCNGYIRGAIRLGYLVEA